MQNEITELRNQVRTLKRIVYGFGCLLVAGVVVSATSLQTVPDVIQAKKFEVVSVDNAIRNTRTPKRAGARDARKRTRTSTGFYSHQHLKLTRLPIPPLALKGLKV